MVTTANITPVRSALVPPPPPLPPLPSLLRLLSPQTACSPSTTPPPRS